ncbi:MAG: AAA family ATPase [Deltaproteobacteria bacterium]|nr:AAA family ATPase [Deltaproteobacteria bacterium]
MKFTELSLERYGVYQQLSVRFASSGLTVIYGPNEAGKSTCLAAISDFLFGIRNDSPHDERFSYNVMRIGATLLLADGRRLILRRRKGRGQTLLDGNDRTGTVSESVLSNLLGDATTRQRFGTLFGLDHRSLREDGETLLSANGDIGRMILEAGGGLRALIKSIDELGGKADSLFAPRRSKDRAFYQICDRFNQAEGEVKKGRLTFEDYQGAEELLKDAERRHQGLTERRVRLEIRQSALLRTNRVLPLLAQLDDVDREIRSYADVSHLRSDFPTDVRDTLIARERAHSELDGSATRCETLEGRIGDLMVDEAALAAEAEIATIHEKSIHVVKEREDQPHREKELEEQKAKLLRLRDYLKLEANKDLKAYLPSADLRDHVRQLILAGTSLKTEMARLGKEVADNQSESKSISEKQQKFEEKGFNRSLAIDVAMMKALPRLLSEAKQRNSRVQEIEREINRELVGWGFSNVAELREFQCPDLETIQAEIERRKNIADEIKDQQDELRDASKKLSIAQKAIERLHAAGEVPTDAAIGQARLTRKEAWVPIRSAYLSDDASALALISRSERERNTRRLEESIEDADRLADRKSAEAQRLTDLAAAEKQRDDAMTDIEAATKALKQSESERAEQGGRFAEAWPQAIRKESDLTRLKLLLRQRNTTLEQAEKAASLWEEANARQGEADQALASLALAETDLGLHPPANTDLQKRLHGLERAANAYAEGRSEWLRNAAKLEELDRHLTKARREIDRLNNQHSEWHANWQQAISRVRLPLDSSIEFVEQVLNEWSEAGDALARIDIAQHRLDQFARDEQDLAERIGKLSPQLSFELPDDSVPAARMLLARWQTANDLATQRRMLAKQLRDAKRDCEEKRRKADELNGEIQNLCTEANADNETALKSIADRLSELLKKRTRRTEILGQIHAAGDGKPLEELCAECEGLDPDRAKAELEEIKIDKEHLDQEIQQAYAEIQTRKRQLESFEAAAGINAAESRRQSAAAEMRAVIERYLEAELARKLLNQAINRLRDEQQNPLIARAGELFRLATRGSFAGIATDVDADGNPVVVGKRASGEQVPYHLMSDGARDQLFLAFRLASIEDYCVHAEPLPFIADDLLIHFDDDRSAETLALLAELGRTTQVLLFTHHRSVRDAAGPLAAQGTAWIVDLPSPVS